MAIYLPARSWERATDICKILRSEEKDSFTSYVIQISVHPYQWCVSRRYKQFVELHNKIVKYFSLEKNILPPKKVFGNKTESFIRERQKGLEVYLQKIIHHFSLLPESLAAFLDFNKYEVRWITSSLAEEFFTQGDNILRNTQMYEFSPLELYAVTERLKLGEPTCYTNNAMQDIAHLIEFISCLQHLKITGSNECFLNSNIVPNSLTYDLTVFRSLETLEMNCCSVDETSIHVDTLQGRLKSFIVHNSVKEFSALLLSGNLHWSPSCPLSDWPEWKYITYANFSCNSLKRIDSSVKLLTQVIHLDLSYNEIEVIENLESLSNLECMVISHNKIQNLESLHSRIGNIHTIDLSFNRIKSLQGLSKLFSVSKLYLQGNYISSISEITYLCKLPCLELLDLKNNPVAFCVDFRSKVLLAFGLRAAEIELNGSKATEKEIDTMSVLHALKLARGDSEAADSYCEDLVDKKLSKNDQDRKETACAKESSERHSNTTLHNLSEAAKFRQHIETLRRIGGSDWLHLLNEQNSSTEFQGKSLPEKIHHCQQESVDVQLHAISPFERNDKLSLPDYANSLATSWELSYPECILLFDKCNESFKQQFIRALVNKGPDSDTLGLSSKETEYSLLLAEGKILWLILISNQGNSIDEVPVCVIVLKVAIVVLEVVNFLPNRSSDNCYYSSFLPEFSHFKTISASNILSLSVGPCHTYVDLNVKIHENLETLSFLFSDPTFLQALISYCQEFYNVTTTHKINPFINEILAFETFENGFSFSNIQKTILFIQRVRVSKMVHKSLCGVLHYVSVTKSHVVLIEESLSVSQLNSLDATFHPHFHICTLVSVHTNVKQIHLTDMDDFECSKNAYEHSSPADINAKNSHLKALYKCGFWVIIEFETEVLLCLNFFSLKQRNEFLDVFLLARSQRLIS